jgi:hypothetical protein
VTAFRNVLIACGAAFGADFVVTTLRTAGGPPSFSVGWAIGSGVIIAVLAGASAGIGTQTNRPAGWSVLLAALVALDAGTGAGKGVFSSASSQAAAEVTAKAIAALIAFACFHIARDQSIRRTAHANAA